MSLSFALLLAQSLFLSAINAVKYKVLMNSNLRSKLMLGD